MKTLWQVYFREWLGLLLLSFLLISSFYLALKEYYIYRYQLRSLKLLEDRLSEVQRIKTQLALYDHYPFWRSLSAPQKIYIQEKVALHPLKESLTKLSELYVEKGFFFLDHFRLETCLDSSSKKERNCIPHFEVKGQKILF